MTTDRRASPVPDASAPSRDPWVAWTRRMILREVQVRGSLERHAPVLPQDIRARYQNLLELSENRLRTLESVLARRGQGAGRFAVAVVRTLGLLAGRLTQRGGARRILSMDIDGVRGLERAYFEASHEKPPHDLSCALTRFIGEIETERSALVKIAKPLF